MHSIYEPIYGSTVPPHLLRKAAERTFLATRAILGTGLKSSIRTGMASGKPGIRLAVMNFLTSADGPFKSFRAARKIFGWKTLKNRKTAKWAATTKGTEQAAEGVAKRLNEHILLEEGRAARLSAGEILDQLPNKKTVENGMANGADITIDAGGGKNLTLTKADYGPFYTESGGKRAGAYSEKLADAKTIGEGTANAWFKPSTRNGAKMGEVLDGIRKGERGKGTNFLKNSIEELYKKGGRLSDESLHAQTEAILKSSDYLDAMAALASKPPISKPATISRITAKNTKDAKAAAAGTGTERPWAITTRKFILRAGGVGVAAWILNSNLKLLTGGILDYFTDDDCGPKIDRNFPELTQEEREAKIEECMDAAALRTLYFGAAAIGVGGLVVLFIASRIFQKKKKTEG